MLYGSETWAITKTSLQRLERKDGYMIRWICGMQGTHTNDIRDIMGIQEVSEVLRARRLRWFGHTQRATSCINTIIGMPFPGPRGPGGQNKTWSTCVKDDQRVMGMRNNSWAVDSKKRRVEGWCETVPDCCVA